MVLRSDVPLAESELTAGEGLSHDESEVVDLGSVSAGVGAGAGAGAAGVSSAVGVSVPGARQEGVRRVSGAKSFFSLMVRTIFSRSSGVMWRSRPLLRTELESFRWRWGRVIFTGADVEFASSLSNSIASSSANDSTLPDKSGISAVYRPLELRVEMEIAGVVAFASPCSQQKVSLFHSLQLRFSRRRPSSTDPAHREKTRQQSALYELAELPRVGLTSPHAKQVLNIPGVDFVEKPDIHGQDGGFQSRRHACSMARAATVRETVFLWDYRDTTAKDR